MSAPVEVIEIGQYHVEIFYDEDAMNPMKEHEGAPSLVLHDKAEGHFGWTNNEEWADRLNAAMDRLAESRATKSMYGERGALDVIARWLRVFHGIPVVLPVGAMEHSGTTAYLGSGPHWCDSDGWDSGWVGWLFFTGEQIAEGWPSGVTPEELERQLRNAFSEFSSYVNGNCYGYIVKGPDGEELEDGSCWGFYGSESYDEAVAWFTVARHLLPGMRVRCSDGTTDAIVSIRDDTGLMTEPHWGGRSPSVHQGTLLVEWNDRSDSTFEPDDDVVTFIPGYMREAFMDAIERDRADRADKARLAHENRVAMYRELVDR